MKMRVGIPLTGGQLVRAARDANYPVLFSANAFFTGYPKDHSRAGDFLKFKDIDLAQFDGLDAALDSAGFVAAVKYGDYRWTPEAYMELAAAFPWSWYASMDYCCEPAVAGDRPLRILRMAATASLLGRLNRLADDRQMRRPMPVIQGWTADEYIECASWLPLETWPDLVGVGSVCRRHLAGPDGIFAILDALDRTLAPHVKLHLFGVKSTALARLAAHPRMASVDSMGWDFAARCERRVGRDMDFRVSHMHDWAEKQSEIVRAAREFKELQRVTLDDRQRNLFPLDEYRVCTTQATHESLALEALAMTWADLLLSDATEYADAVWGAQVDAYPLLARIHQLGVAEACDETEQEFCGFRDNLVRVAESRNPALAELLHSHALEQVNANPMQEHARNAWPALAA